MRSSKREGWEIAMRQEIQALEENKVWGLVKRGPNINALHTKWVFKTNSMHMAISSGSRVDLLHA